MTVQDNVAIQAISDWRKIFAKDREQLHMRLGRWNQTRLEPSFPAPGWRERMDEEASLRLLEGGFLEGERQAVERQASLAPEAPADFMEWFTNLLASGPGQGDALFPWLATRATLEQMRWFLAQELAGEAGYDDLVALAQIKLARGPKLELARNYWDEMGGGDARFAHAALLEDTAEELGIRPARKDAVWESVALSNLMIGLACNRSYAYQAIGALGVIEMTAPSRVSKVNEGLKRLGVSVDGRRYFALHAGLDIKHSAGWNAEVIAPLIDGNPWIARAIAEGALMRLKAGQACFARYRKHFGLS
jgi:hypothetical protein